MENNKIKNIEIKNLSFSYDEKSVFVDFFASFPAGEMSIIMSPSGSGKTTLLYLIAGLIDPDEGAIECPNDAKKVSFVFQDDRLIEQLSVEKNIRFVNSKLKDKEIEECSERLGIKDMMTKKVKCLSGGERQRVAIARALLADYDILLLDEPFTGIDDENKNRVIEYLKEKTRGKTVLLVTHDKEEAEALGAKEVLKGLKNNG